uniref:Thionin-like protein 2 n=1 Tax=Nelumbo nucifera TaxID=4432 RepID=A0A822Y3F8_NELNU|nr:TPA_asm: hypothetical protein HUJ06_028425 [Nelumbo nucifera]
MKMDGNSVIVLMVMIMALDLFAGQSVEGSFDDCYRSCYVWCIKTPEGTVVSCAWKCLKHCIFHGSSVDDPHNKCILNCALSSCSNISTPQNPAEKKVGDRVNNCSQKCNKKY